MRGIVWACLATLMLASHCYAQDLQYFWVKPDKVLLWKTVDDPNPVTATYESATRNWTITPEKEAGTWQEILKGVAKEHYSQINLDAYKDDGKVSSLMLATLHNAHPNIEWAKAREPLVEIFWQQTGDQAVRAVFLTKDQNQAQTPETFSVKNGVWQKTRNIDLGTVFNVEDSPRSLRTIFGLPTDGPAADTDWASAWDDFAKTSFEGEAIRPVMYQDASNKQQWIWLEKKQNNLPTEYVSFAKLPPNVKEPDPDTKADTDPHGMTWLETAQLVALLLLAGLLVALIWNAFAKRKQVWQFISQLIGHSQENRPETPTAGRAMISAEGLNLLYQTAMLRLQNSPRKKTNKAKGLTKGVQSGDNLEEAVGRDLLIQALSWAHQEYLKIIDSDQFLESVGSLKDQFFEEQYREWDLEPSEAGQIKGWITLGRAFENATVVASKVGASPFVKTVIEQNSTVPKSAADWSGYWPTLLNDLGDLAKSEHETRIDIQQQLETVKSEQQRSISQIERDLTSKAEASVAASAAKLEEVNRKYLAASNELEQEEQNSKRLEAELKTIAQQLKDTEKEWQEGKTNLISYEQVFSEVQEVKKLSRLLRQWLQGYFAKQQDTTGEVRSVGLMAALVNYSLYQMCFSILENHQPMRKAMAQNLFTISQVFSQNSNYVTVCDALKRIDPKVEGAFDEVTNPTGSTIDDPLFQAFLRSLQADTKYNLGPFFIDEKEEKINLVNAS